MPSTPSTRLKLEKQATGENLNAWGTRLNTSQDLIDERVDGLAINSGGNFTLSMTNYTSSDGRKAVQRITGTATTITLPGQELNRWFHNATASDITITLGSGTTATVRAGQLTFVHTNGTNAVWAADPTLDTIKDPAAARSMAGQKITNLGTGTNSTDAANVGQVTALVSPFATAAADSATTATTQAGIATTQAGIATTQANLAIAAFDDFDDRYLGSKASDPALDNDGNALATGALYFNTSAGQLRVFNGASWVAITVLALASQVQAEAGTDNATAMTPLRVAQALTARAVDVVTEVFTSSGTFTKNALDLAYFVEVIGAGASGGRETTADTLGGQAGEWVDRWLLASEVGATETVTVGSGGAARTTNGLGNAGGSSSFGTLVVARGGLAPGGTATPCYQLPLSLGGYQGGTAPGGAFNDLGIVFRGIFSNTQSNGAALDALTVDAPTPGGHLNGGGVTGRATSRRFGTGGLANSTAGQNAGTGGAPGGGGGAKNGATTGNSGAGGRGEVRVMKIRRKA